jgi:hypothetical protein
MAANEKRPNLSPAPAKVGEGKKPKGIFKRVEDARKQLGSQRRRDTVDPNY